MLLTLARMLWLVLVPFQKYIKLIDWIKNNNNKKVGRLWVHVFGIHEVDIELYVHFIEFWVLQKRNAENIPRQPRL